MRCPDCERITSHIFDNTVFWLYLPTTDSFNKVSAWCRQNNYGGEPFDSHGLKVTIKRGSVSRFLTALYGEINGQELAGTKILTTDGSAPGPADMGRVMTADVFISRFQAGWLVEALEQQRLESWYQPIISARGGNVFAYEALLRMRDSDGAQIPPGHIFPLADKADLLFPLDLAARRAAVEGASRARLRGKVFINFNPSSIYDPAYCLRTTAAAIEEVGLRPRDIVFEVTETHQAQDAAHLKGILAFYRRAGFGVALDDIGSGYSSLNMLHDMRPDYAKIDMDLVRDVHLDSFRQTIVKSIIDIASTNGIRTIAEGVENELEAAWLTEAGADYLQGFLFGKPQAMEAEAA